MKVTHINRDVLRQREYEVTDKTVLELNGATIEIRQSRDGHAMVIVVTDGLVSMEPRAAGIWLVVKAPL